MNIGLQPASIDGYIDEKKNTETKLFELSGSWVSVCFDVKLIKQVETQLGKGILVSTKQAGGVPI